MSADFDLSLAIPCYNEAGHLEASVDELIAVLERTRWRYEVVFVDDQSRDDTRAVLERVVARYPMCRVIHHPRNMGRGAAFKTGFRNTTGRITGFIDIDLEVHARYIPALVDAVERGGYDVVTGCRHYLLSQTGAVHRHVLSFSYRMLCHLLLGLGVKDSETGCKFFRRETTAEVVLGSESDGWFWDTEVMSRAALQNLRIHEVPVLFLRRLDKKSTVRLGPDILKYLEELDRFRARVGLSLKDRSPIYWTASGYDAVMRGLYRGELDAMHARVASFIPPGASVVDLCAGTCRLYLDHLRGKVADYVGLDANGHFVMAARKRGVEAKLFDVAGDEIPAADYVIMSSSFYHFIDDADALLTRMRKAARRAVIISEPVENLSTHANPWVAKVAHALTRPGARDAGATRADPAAKPRFDRGSFERFARTHGASVLEMAPGSKNAIAVFPASVAEVTSAHQQTSSRP